MSIRSLFRPLLPDSSSAAGLPPTLQLSFIVQVPLQRSRDIWVKVTRPWAAAGTALPSRAPPTRRDNRKALATRVRPNAKTACVLIRRLLSSKVRSRYLRSTGLLDEECHRSGSRIAGAVLHGGDDGLVKAGRSGRKGPGTGEEARHLSREPERQGLRRGLSHRAYGGGHREVGGNPRLAGVDLAAAHHGHVHRERNGIGKSVGWDRQVGGGLHHLNQQARKL